MSMSSSVASRVTASASAPKLMSDSVTVSSIDCGVAVVAMVASFLSGVSGGGGIGGGEKYVERRGRRVGHAPRREPGEHGARARVYESGRAGGGQRDHRLSPAHGGDERVGELLARVAEWLGRRAGDDGDIGATQLDLVERLAEGDDGTLHLRRVKRAADIERDRAQAGAASVVAGRLQRVRRAG